MVFAKKSDCLWQKAVSVRGRVEAAGAAYVARYYQTMNQEQLKKFELDPCRVGAGQVTK
jgi:hypothetical protein